MPLRAAGHKTTYVQRVQYTGTGGRTAPMPTWLAKQAPHAKIDGTASESDALRRDTCQFDKRLLRSDAKGNVTWASGTCEGLPFSRGKGAAAATGGEDLNVGCTSASRAAIVDGAAHYRN
jgi:hypothetical protein